jgi:hypothetical protein
VDPYTTWSARRGSGDSPTAGSLWPGGWRGGRCCGLPAADRACGVCACRISSRPACGARLAVSLASRGRSRPSVRGVSAVPARRTTPGRLACTGSVRRAGAGRRSRAGALTVQRPCQIPAREQDREVEYPANQQVDDRERHLVSQPSPPPGRSGKRRPAMKSSIRAAQVPQHQDFRVFPPPLPPRQAQQRYRSGNDQEDQLQAHKPKIIPPLDRAWPVGGAPSAGHVPESVCPVAQVFGILGMVS